MTDTTSSTLHRDFRRVAILNRGEPAIRFLRAIREYNFERGLSIKAIAFYTEPDTTAPFVRLADEMVSLGPALQPGPDGVAVSAYTHHDLVLDKLEEHRCDAVWPGWGFLSEDPTFVAKLEARGIVFLGPSSVAMKRLGDKIESKLLADEYDVPMGAWSLISDDMDESVLRKEAERIGFPLMVKASAGGGGRGIRKVREIDGLLPAIKEAREEVRKVFGQGGLFMEACITGARHIEVQFVVGVDGEAVALGVRDCSIQRRNQKVIEEAPSPILPENIETLLCESTVRLARGAGYRGVGTAEYMFQVESGNASFLEVNSRLQVEHTVTEYLTGCDLVKAQIDIARGLPWRDETAFKQERGHAIEVRLNAENPEQGFRPSPGLMKMFRPPSGPGIRVDSGVGEGTSIAPEFDSMIAKVIAWGPTRKQAVARLERALREFQVVVEDGATNKAFLLDLLCRKEFVEATADTTWLDGAVLEGDFHAQAWEFEALLLAAIVEYRLQWHTQVQRFFAQVQNGIPQEIPAPEGLLVNLRLRGNSHAIEVCELGEGRYLVGPSGGHQLVLMETIDPHTAVLHINDRRHQVLYAYGRTGITVEVDGTMHVVERASGGTVKAPAPALVVHVAVEEGQDVQAGDLLCTLEVMKMEMLVKAQEAGCVRSILCRPNQQVNAGQSLVVIESKDEQASEENTAHYPTPPPTPLDTLFVDGEPQPNVLDELDELQAKQVMESLCESVNSVFLGFDVTTTLADKLETLFGEGLSFSGFKHPERWKPLVQCLRAFSDSESLFDRTLLPRAGQAAAVSAELDYYDFCRRHPEGEDGAQETFKPLLMRALHWYGIHSLEPVDELREALCRLAVGHAHGALRHRLCSSLLRLLMGLYEAGVSYNSQEDAGLSDVLEEVARVAHRKFPFVADNARQARYVLFEQSRYVARRHDVEQMLDSTLKQLESLARNRKDCTQLVNAIASSQRSLLSILLWKLKPHSEATEVVAQAIIRRLYLDQEVKELSCTREGDIVRANYIVSLDEKEVEVLAAFAHPSSLPLALKSISSALNSEQTDKVTYVECVLLGEVEGHAFDDAVQHVAKEFSGLSGQFERLTISWCNGLEHVRHRTYEPADTILEEVPWLCDVHPEAARRIELQRLQEFSLERLPAPEHIYAFLAQGRNNPKDTRVFLFAELHEVPELESKDTQDELLEFERVFFEGLRVIREVQSQLSLRKRFHWNRFTLYVRPTIDFGAEDLSRFARRFESPTRGLGLQKLVINANTPVKGKEGETQPVEFVISKRGRHRLEVHLRKPHHQPVRAMTPYDMKVVRARRLGTIYPYELIVLLEGRSVLGLTPHPDMARGKFVEYDLDESGDMLVPVERERGLNTAGVVVGLVTNVTTKYPEGMERVWIASDPTMAMGSLAEPECRRILAGLQLAEERGLPVEWLPISAGARIAMDSGTENLDWTAKVLKKIVEFTQRGGEINIIVSGVNVGAQSYWNAEATMLMHARGVLIMTPDASMVLTGKKALEYSGGVAAEDERGIGGYERIMGPNGQAQFFAQDLGEAYKILFEYYRFSYQHAQESHPRRLKTADPVERSILDMPYNPSLGDAFQTVGEIFDPVKNPGRKKPFAVREVMKAVIDQDGGHLERYAGMRHADTAVVWDVHVGGFPVCMIGFESRPQPRRGRIPIDGPDAWTGGTLFPQSSKKVAFAINAASGNRPVVVLANLSGFDGSPESLRKLQLEMGAEIGRAIVNFDGPIVFTVIGRYHGGAYVVFSKSLNPNLTAIALEDTYASVIGGAPAAAVVFPHKVRQRTEKDQRIIDARAELQDAPTSKKPRLREQFESLYEQVYLEKQGQVAKEFDDIHTVERAVRCGSLDKIIKPANLRPAIIDIIQQQIGHVDA